MRGIGVGQTLQVFVIPEVKQLMQRELAAAAFTPPVGAEAWDHTLEDVVAWLVVNSMRSEQTQWTMLCIQNIANLYRKNAFATLYAEEGCRALVKVGSPNCRALVKVGSSNCRAIVKVGSPNCRALVSAG